MTEAELRDIEDLWCEDACLVGEALNDGIDAMFKALRASWAETARYADAMERITKRDGRLGDEDPRTDAGQLQHMRNIIENMASIAEECLRPQTMQETPDDRR